MNIYDICDNRFTLIFQWNADECSMHLLHLHTCCVCSRPEIVTFDKLRIHVPPHPWQGCYVRLESISKAYLLITDALPSRKTKIDWMNEHVLLESLCCHLWKYDLSSNELEVTSLNDILAQAEILERICRVVVAWLVCVYSVHSVLGLETWYAAMQKQHPTSKTITGHSAKVRWGWKSPWNMRTESDVRNSYFEVTMDEWIQKQKSRYGLPWQEAPTEDVLRCFGVLPFFLLNRARLLTVEIPREHPKLLFHVWRCSHVVGYCSNKDLHMTLRLTLPQKYVNGANKEALKSRMGKEGSRSVFGEKKIHRLLTYPVLKSCGG